MASVIIFLPICDDLRYCAAVNTSLIMLATSVDSQAAAESLAHGLVDARLAACVQISQHGVSVYRWQGRVESSGEYYLSIKTTMKSLDDALVWLREHHPYDVPELVWWPAHADDAYAAWMQEITID